MNPPIHISQSLWKRKRSAVELALLQLVPWKSPTLPNVKGMLMSVAASRNFLKYFFMEMFLVINAFYFKIVKPPASLFFCWCGFFFFPAMLKEKSFMARTQDSIPGSATGVLSEQDQATMFQLFNRDDILLILPHYLIFPACKCCQ